MKRLEEIKRQHNDHMTRMKLLPSFDMNIDWMIQEIERLRTVEQAYQALLSATAGQQK